MYEFAIPPDIGQSTGECPRQKRAQGDVADFYQRFSQDLLEIEARDRSAKMLLKELFAENFAFPPAAAMHAEELGRKLRDIRDTLEKNGVMPNIQEGVPPLSIYRFLKQKIFSVKIPRARPAGYLYLIGCDWECPVCFQRDYCLVGAGETEQFPDK